MTYDLGANKRACDVSHATLGAVDTSFSSLPQAKYQEVRDCLRRHMQQSTKYKSAYSVESLLGCACDLS
eukprot:4199186-Amphidinium_carterae.3